MIVILCPALLSYLWDGGVLPVAPFPANLDSRALFFGRAQKRAPESTELAYREERTSRQTVFFPSAFYRSSTLVLYSSRIAVTLNLSSKRSTVRKGQEHLKFVH